MITRDDEPEHPRDRTRREDRRRLGEHRPAAGPATETQSLVLAVPDSHAGDSRFPLRGTLTAVRPPRTPEGHVLGQLVDSVNYTLEGQIDPEQHGERTVEGVAVRFARRVLALAAAIWHNFQTGQAVSRTLNAYDH